MSRLAHDSELQAAMREFIIAVNRVDNARVRDAAPQILTDLNAMAEAAGLTVEDALVQRGWAPPTTRRITTLTMPDASPDASLDGADLTAAVTALSDAMAGSY